MATDFELAVMQELSEIKAQGSSTATAVTSLEKRLFNGSGVIPTMQADIDEIKSDVKEEQRWEKVKGILQSSVPAGVLVTLHMLAHKLGWKV